MVGRFEKDGYAKSQLRAYSYNASQSSTTTAETIVGDETPGAVNYGTWWSPCDSIINPDSSVSLSGATNTKTACISRTSLPTDETVYTQVREFVK